MSSKRKLANEMVPCSAMHPGELLRDELKARAMKQIEFAKELIGHC